MKKIYTILFILTISSQLLVAQNLKRANNLFERRAYINAAELYLNEENKTQEIYEKLGDCYYFNTEMKQATLYYKILLNNYAETAKPTYLFRYAEALKGIKNFKEADIWLQKYYQEKNITTSKNPETMQFFDDLNNQIERPYIIHNVSSNTTKSDFGPAFYKNNIIFSSARGNGDLYDWNNQPYLDLYKAEISTSGDLVNVSPFSKNINTKMHESNAIFTKDGKTMYFTRNNYLNGKKGRDAKKISHLKIYKAQLIENQWTNITELPFNNTNYSVEHPALSPDENQLYFASDMPGSIGSFDLFVVDIFEDGTYGTPKNLGDKINTEQREQFPFISSTNTLYFASNGHFGLGGLDVFKSKIDKGVFSKPINLSNIINSNLDDFSFIINEEKETGYFSSNRKGGKGDDDIYRFTQLKVYKVQGLVKNKNSDELLPGSLVTLFNNENTVIADMIVGDEAKYAFKIENNKTYKIRGTRKFFNPYEVEFATDNSGNINKNISLVLESYEDAEKKVVEENGKIQIKINPIYFDFDKWNIRKDAAKELDSIVAIMKKYPTMVIEIGAHTDCRGPEEYNLNLSHKRAKSVREYLIKQGILNDNLKSIGYGEMQPLNNCIREGICTEKEYDINRRCEFVILN